MLLNNFIKIDNNKKISKNFKKGLDKIGRNKYNSIRLVDANCIVNDGLLVNSVLKGKGTGYEPKGRS